MEAPVSPSTCKMTPPASPHRETSPPSSPSIERMTPPTSPSSYRVTPPPPLRMVEPPASVIKKMQQAGRMSRKRNRRATNRARSVRRQQARAARRTAKRPRRSPALALPLTQEEHDRQETAELYRAMDAIWSQLPANRRRYQDQDSQSDSDDSSGSESDHDNNDTCVANGDYSSIPCADVLSSMAPRDQRYMELRDRYLFQLQKEHPDRFQCYWELRHLIRSGHRRVTFDNIPKSCSTNDHLRRFAAERLEISECYLLTLSGFGGITDEIAREIYDLTIGPSSSSSSSSSSYPACSAASSSSSSTNDAEKQSCLAFLQQFCQPPSQTAAASTDLTRTSPANPTTNPAPLPIPAERERPREIKSRATIRALADACLKEGQQSDSDSGLESEWHRPLTEEELRVEPWRRPWPDVDVVLPAAPPKIVKPLLGVVLPPMARLNKKSGDNNESESSCRLNQIESECRLNSDEL